MTITMGIISFWLWRVVLLWVGYMGYRKYLSREGRTERSWIRGIPFIIAWLVFMVLAWVVSASDVANIPTSMLPRVLGWVFAGILSFNLLGELKALKKPEHRTWGHWAEIIFSILLVLMFVTGALSY